MELRRTELTEAELEQRAPRLVCVCVLLSLVFPFFCLRLPEASLTYHIHFTVQENNMIYAIDSSLYKAFLSSKNLKKGGPGEAGANKEKSSKGGDKGVFVGGSC